MRLIPWVNGYTLILMETPSEKARGLQGLSSLPEKTLMLFSGVSAGSYFHTKNCLFPIDIISLDGSFSVLDIWTVQPEQDRIGPTPLDSQFVLEAPAGWAKAGKIKKGSRLARC